MENTGQPEEKTIAFCDAPAHPPTSGFIALEPSPIQITTPRRVKLQCGPGVVALVLVLLAFGGGLALALLSFNRVEQTSSPAAVAADKTTLEYPRARPVITATPRVGGDEAFRAAQLALAQPLLRQEHVEGAIWDPNVSDAFDLTSAAAARGGGDEGVQLALGGPALASDAQHLNIPAAATHTGYAAFETVAVPEPGTIALLALAPMLLLARRFRA